jgi:exodeoxyribonuclease VII small subunit
MSKIEITSYEDALQKLQNIVKQLENREIKIDDLAQTISHAKELVDFCRDKLNKTEEEINKIIQPQSDEDMFNDLEE